jgi:tyrosyl-tRNA synthetase
MDDGELAQIFEDVPSEQLSFEVLQGDGLSVVDAFCATPLAGSKGEARRSISQGGAYVNNRRVEQPEATLTPSDLAGESMIVLRSGKKKYAILRFS